jgi:hypothetical protein
MTMAGLNKMTRQRGALVVLVTASIMVLLGAIALAVDVGYLYVVRNQLQNAVDAAAMAGAQGLLVEPRNYSPDGQAMRWAIEYGARNRADGAPVQLSPEDITFPRSNVIKVQKVHLVRTFFAAVLGIRRVPVGVQSAAVATPARGSTGGWRPFAPPDQFAHGSQCVTPADEDHGPYNPDLHTWNGIAARDYYKSPYAPEFENWDVSAFRDCSLGNPTGFITPRDEDGRLVELKTDRPAFPGNFYPVSFGERGANAYRDHIIYGWSGTLQVGDLIETEPGNMAGPTIQGVAQLIAQDPTAHVVRENGAWVVKSSEFADNESPRIVPIPLIDPTSIGAGRTTFRVSNIGSFFIIGTRGKSVLGYFIHRRQPQAIAASPPRYGASQTSGASGRFLGTVQFADPAQY